MASKYLSALSKNEYSSLSDKLWNIQNKQCFICEEEIDLDLNTTNIDHIIPLANKGKDAEENFALTHESCNKSKQDANLKIAKVLQKLNKIQKVSLAETSKAASLKDVLNLYNGSKFEFIYKIEGEVLSYSFSNNSDNNVYSVAIFTDNLSGEQSCFIEVPIEYLFHDEIINPRGINNSIGKLIKEFDKKNPQLHLSLARIDDGKLKIFDGQHKAVAQILLGTRKFVVRIFLNPNIDRLTETNTNAGSTLRQIAFDKSIMRQLNNTLYSERVKKYQIAHNFKEDDFSFSEQQLINFFKGDGANVKKYIIDSIKHSITNAKENKLKDYIDFEGKAKELPISYSAFDKTILSSFVSSKLVLNSPIDSKSDEGLNPRELEISQIVKILSILAENIYINKFSPEVGTSRIEKKIIDKKDTEITDVHLIAYRVSKEEILFNWLQYLKKVITTYFSNTGKIFAEETIFQTPFDEQLWINIENFVVNLSHLPLWKDRSMASTVFSGKKNYDYWKEIFATGKSIDGAVVLAKPLNFIEMIISTEKNV
ncbi:HNH endonuclease [Marinomonas flavescens]|uniref:HNH endonuclease n=1 Tax=Marinomonas flavescens TaxID=2529379 RepID=UPI0010567228|nr:HNH endonuclease signature motif containing protein [Marinomonas flavescens]